MSTLVCFALKEEAAPFRRRAAQRPGVFTLITGMGRERAGLAVRDFLGMGAAVAPSRVFTCGFAGGLHPDGRSGEVIFEIAGPDAALNAALRAKLLAAGAKPGTFFCADRIAITAAEKRRLRAETGADAVEMESAAIHAVCRERGLPCATVRVISDAADEDLPLDFNALFKPDQSLRWGRLLLTLARSPGKIGALPALQKQPRRAAQRLAEVLTQALA